MKKEILNDEGVPSKNQKQLSSFVEYCLEHPELRFWQALINWAGFNISRVDVNKNKVEYKDLFYL